MQRPETLSHNSSQSDPTPCLFAPMSQKGGLTVKVMHSSILSHFWVCSHGGMNGNQLFFFFLTRASEKLKLRSPNQTVEAPVLLLVTNHEP